MGGNNISKPERKRFHLLRGCIHGSADNDQLSDNVGNEPCLYDSVPEETCNHYVSPEDTEVEYDRHIPVPTTTDDEDPGYMPFDSSCVTLNSQDEVGNNSGTYEEPGPKTSFGAYTPGEMVYCGDSDQTLKVQRVQGTRNPGDENYSSSPVTQRSFDTVTPAILSLHSDHDSSLKVDVDQSGKRFDSPELRLTGFVPEGAVSEPTSLYISKEDSKNYQAILGENQRFISDLYQICPLGIIMKRHTILRFPHSGTCTLPFSNSAPCLLTRHKILFCYTKPEATPKWKDTERTQDIKAVVTEDEVCLMLLQPCNFVAVEEQVPTKFVTVEIYGFFCADRKLKITVLVSGNNFPKQGCLGDLLEQQDLILVHDVDHIIVKLLDVPNEWKLIGAKNPEMVLYTFYLWNNKSQSATFIVEDVSNDTQQDFIATINLKHENITAKPIIATRNQQMTVPERNQGANDEHIRHNQVSCPGLGLPTTCIYPGVHTSSHYLHQNYTEDERPISAFIPGRVILQKSTKLNPTVSTDTTVEEDNPAQKGMVSQSGVLPKSHEYHAIATKFGNSSGTLTSLVKSNMSFTGNVPMSKFDKPKLNHAQKVKISGLLTDTDWRDLAKQMNLLQFEDLMVMDEGDPINCLLDIWESGGGSHSGSMDCLVKALHDIGRSDVISAIDNADYNG